MANKNNGNRNNSKSNSNKKIKDSVPVNAADLRSEKYAHNKYKFRNEHDVDNDWRWYASDDKILKDTASFPYLYPLGEIIDKGPSAGIQANSWSIPGITAIYTAPSLGYTNAPSDPVTIAARNFYTAVRARNSGATNTYEAPDMLMYFLAMDGIFSIFANIRRAYGVIQQYGKVNRYYSSALVYAMGFDYEDLMRNLNDFRANINVLQNKISSYVVPSSVPYIARHYWMYSNMYYDTPNNPKAQIMMYVPEGIWKLTRDENQATALRPWPWMFDNYRSSVVEPRNSDSRTGWKCDQIIKYIEDLTDLICSSQVINVMCGDMLKYFGPEGCIRVAEIEADYRVQPVYSEEVLSQMQNATLLGRWMAPSDYGDDEVQADASVHNSVIQDLTIDGGWVISHTHAHFIDALDESDEKPSFGSMLSQSYTANKLLTFPHAEVTPEMTIVGSRLTNIPDAITTSDHDSYDIPSETAKYDIADFLSCIENGTGLENWADYHCTLSDANASQSYSSYPHLIKTCGSDIACYAKVFYYAYPNRGEIQRTSLIASEDIYYVVPQFRKFQITEGISDVTDIADQMDIILTKNDDDFRRMAFLSNFTLHPPITYMTATRSTLVTEGGSALTAYNYSQYQTDFVDINYYTLLSHHDLVLMSKGALLSELAIAAAGTVELK